MNPGINKFLDRVDEVNYYTIDNAIECIERENFALDALQASLLCVGFSDSSSSSSSGYSPPDPIEEYSSGSSSSSSYSCSMACGTENYRK